MPEDGILGFGGQEWRGCAVQRADPWVVQKLIAVHNMIL